MLVLVLRMLRVLNILLTILIINVISIKNKLLRWNNPTFWNPWLVKCFHM